MISNQKYIIFPNSNIVEIIKHLDSQYTRDVIFIVPEKVNIDCAPFPTLSEKEWQPEGEIIVYPCSEAALYYIRSQPNYHNFRAPFSHECFDLFLKTQMAKQFTNAGIPYLPKTIISGQPLSYPFIAKPNFGFASSFVKNIKTPADWDDYQDQVKEQYTSSIVGIFHNKYLSHIPTEVASTILTEPSRTDLNFFSVPFLVQNDAVHHIFPISITGTLLGEKKTPRTMQFEFPASNKEKNEVAMLDACQKLVQHFKLDSGVYHAEFLGNTQETYLLEFSPRLTGGALPMLVSLSINVNLLKFAISSFLGIADQPNLSSPINLVLTRNHLRSYTEWEENGAAEKKTLYSNVRETPESCCVEYITERN